MAEHLSLLEFLQKMIDNVGLRDWFAQDPQAAMAHYGLEDVPVEDVRDAITLAEDNQLADFSRQYNTGAHVTFPALSTAAHHSTAPEHHSSGHSSDDHSSSGHSTSHHSTSHHSSGHHSSGHTQTVEHVSHYVTNNHIDDRDTTVDDSLNQQVHTDGGDYTQAVESHSTTASGDHAVAAGEGITDSVVTTGNGNQVGTGNVAGQHNVVGDGNQVAGGNGSTTAFGSGAATDAHIDGATVGAGGALSVGGPADAEQVAVDSHDHTSTDTNDLSSVSDSGNDYSATETNSHNDAHTETSDDSHDHVNVDDSTHDSTSVTLPVDVTL